MWRRRDLLILGLAFGGIAYGIFQGLPDAIESTAFLLLGCEMTPSTSSPWTEKVDPKGNPHTCRHRDGHRVGLFPDGWFAYHRDYRWTPPGSPCIGPEPAGPFNTLSDAKRFVEAQGFAFRFPFEPGNASTTSPA